MSELLIGSAENVLHVAGRSMLSAVCVAGALDDRLRMALTKLAEYAAHVPVLAVQPREGGVMRAKFHLPEAPTLVFLRRGVEVGRLVGLDSEARMKLALDCALEAPPGAESMREEATG